MDLEMVFNELSLQTPAADIETARQWMSELIETVRAATAKGVPGMLRTKSNFYSSELARNYTVSKWFKERDKDLEARLLKSYIRKGWNLDQITELNIQVRDRGEQGETEPSIGLAYAVINNALAVSLKSDRRWDVSRLEITVIQVDDDEELKESIIHASCRDHVQQHADWIQKRIRTVLGDGAELWHRRAELFPNLEFCQDVGEQLQNLRTGNVMLRPVEKRLFELSDYCQTWESGPFDPDSLPSKASPRVKQLFSSLERRELFYVLMVSIGFLVGTSD